MDEPQSMDGNSFGYSRLQREVYEGLLSRGVEIRRGAPIRLQITEPSVVMPAAGRTSVVLSMWESYDLDAGRVRALATADMLLAPSKFSVDVFAKYGLKARRCPLGIDPGAWPFRRRELASGQPFRWLWVGAPNARKGWDVIEIAWMALGKVKGVELYLKTTGTDREEGIVRRGNVIVDNRNVSREELLGIYHSAHGFVFPTAGEGWGLTLHEAMATGLPCVVTEYSGVLDFCDARTTYFVPFVPVATGIETMDGRPAGEVRSMYADPSWVVRAMMAVMGNYREASIRARAGAEKARRFTWGRTVDTLIAHLERAARKAGGSGGGGLNHGPEQLVPDEVHGGDRGHVRDYPVVGSG